jgi:hypothetical protein
MLMRRSVRAEPSARAVGLARSDGELGSIRLVTFVGVSFQ